MFLFVSFSLSAHLTADPISNRYLNQLRQSNSPKLAEQAVVWAVTELGQMLEKTVTQKEVERDISIRVREMLEHIDVASHMMRSETLSVLSNVATVNERIGKSMDDVRVQVRGEITDMMEQTVRQVEDFVILATANPEDFDGAILDRLKLELKTGIEIESPFMHHLLFAAFQVIFVLGIVYYRKLMNSLIM